MTTCETATLAAQVFRLINEDRLADAAAMIEAELAKKSTAKDERYDMIVARYNLLGLPKVMTLTRSRKIMLGCRIKEHPDLKWWDEFFARVRRSPFLMGEKPGVEWKASFDWLMKPANITKVMEGNYDPPRTSRLGADDEAAFRHSGVR